MLPDFRLARPTTYREAFDALDEGGTPYCGGTELLLAMRAGLLAPGLLVDLKRLPGAAEVVADGHTLRLGAAVTHADIIASDTVRDALPYLVEVETRVANPRVRAQGSLVGNLCFAEPKSDVLTALIALRASITVSSGSGSRQESVESFVVGPYDTTLLDGEIVTGVTVPLEVGAGGVYIKFQPRERPTAAVAIFGDGSRVRTVVGAAGEVPVWRESERCTDDVVEELLDELEPIDDLAGSTSYKLHVVRTLLGRAIAAFDQHRGQGLGFR
jgi:carbon-monoxide dehydrogenase medium subunit